jgi:hypothetical protein
MEFEDFAYFTSFRINRLLIILIFLFTLFWTSGAGLVGETISFGPNLKTPNNDPNSEGEQGYPPIAVVSPFLHSNAVSHFNSHSRGDWGMTLGRKHGE